MREISGEPRQKLIIPPTVDVKNDEGALVTIRKISALYIAPGSPECAEDGLENQDKTPARGKKRKMSKTNAAGTRRLFM